MQSWAECMNMLWSLLMERFAYESCYIRWPYIIAVWFLYIYNKSTIWIHCTKMTCLIVDVNSIWIWWSPIVFRCWFVRRVIIKSLDVLMCKVYPPTDSVASYTHVRNVQLRVDDFQLWWRKSYTIPTWRETHLEATQMIVFVLDWTR